jgi:hypothetical protein
VRQQSVAVLAEGRVVPYRIVHRQATSGTSTGRIGKH